MDCMNKCKCSPILLNTFLNRYLGKCSDNYTKSICQNYANFNRLMISYCPSSLGQNCNFFCEKSDSVIINFV